MVRLLPQSRMEIEGIRWQRSTAVATYLGSACQKSQLFTPASCSVWGDLQNNTLMSSVEPFARLEPGWVSLFVLLISWSATEIISRSATHRVIHGTVEIHRSNPHHGPSFCRHRWLAVSPQASSQTTHSKSTAPSNTGLQTGWSAYSRKAEWKSDVSEYLRMDGTDPLNYRLTLDQRFKTCHLFHKQLWKLHFFSQKTTQTCQDTW